VTRKNKQLEVGGRGGYVPQGPIAGDANVWAIATFVGC